MKNKKILIGLSSCALLGAALIGCGGSKGTDTPHIHLLADTQISKYTRTGLTPYYEVVDQATGKSSIEIVPEEERESNKLTVDGWFASYYKTSDIVTMEPEGNTKSLDKLEYGKDVEVKIKPKDFCLLANFENKAFDANNPLTPYKAGYAMPYIGYGNGMSRSHSLPLSRDFYTYTQDKDDAQTFHLTIKGEAFKKNIIVDFTGDTYTEHVDSKTKGQSGKVEDKELYYLGVNLDSVPNSPTLLSSSYKISKGEDSKYESFYSFDSGHSDFAVSDGLKFTVSLDNRTWGVGQGPKTNLTASKLYTMNGLKAGTDFNIVATKTDKTTEVIPAKDYKFEISSDGTFAVGTIPWKTLYNLETYEAIYDSSKPLEFICSSEPKKSIDITHSITGTSEDIVDLDSGYGCNPACTPDNFIGLKKSSAHNSIFSNDSAQRCYRVLLRVKQAKEGKDDPITWPNVTITSKIDDNAPVITTLDLDNKYATKWRSDYYKDQNVDGETELPYRLTKDGNFVVVCLNPGYRTNVIDPEGGVPISEKHNLFMIYDYYGKSSYYVGETGKYATTVNIAISK